MSGIENYFRDLAIETDICRQTDRHRKKNRERQLNLSSPCDDDNPGLQVRWLDVQVDSRDRRA